jgi:hypothetical protein
MTPLSLTPNAREHRFHGATSTCGLRFPLSTGGLSCFLLPTSLCSRQREVGAAPHRGNANRPLTNQGKAPKPDQGKAPKPDQGKATTLGIQTNKRRQRQNPHFPSDNPRSSAATPAGNSTLTPRSTIVRPSACKVLNRLCSRHCSPICPIRTIGKPNEPEISTW